MKSDFKERRQARIERLKERAAKHEREGEGRINQARNMASFIPFGQPILIGHHSEKGDRNYRAKIETNFNKGFSQLKYAGDLLDRSEVAASNHAIFSDDPEVIQKLKKKIDTLEKRQDLMKKANKIIKTKKTDPEKIELLKKLGIEEERAYKLLIPGFGGLGYASFTLTNNNATIKNAKDRLLVLERLNQQQTTETEINGVRVLDNVEDNRLQLFFPCKPSEEFRKLLKSNGYRWSPSQQAWQRQRNSYTLRQGKELAAKLSI